MNLAALDSLVADYLALRYESPSLVQYPLWTVSTVLAVSYGPTFDKRELCAAGENRQ